MNDTQGSALQFADAWNDLRTSVERGTVSSPKSPAWEELIRDFRLGGDFREIERELFGATRWRSYNFCREDRGRRIDSLRRGWLRLTFLASAALRRLSGRLWSPNVGSAVHAHRHVADPEGQSQLMAYPRFETALRRQDLWDAYRQTCADLHVTPFSFHTAKLYYVSSLVRRWLPPDRSTELCVLEIGAGLGNLCVLLQKQLPVRQYVILDLPEMVLLSSITIRHFFPDLPIHFSHLSTDPVLRLPDRGVLFCYPQDVSRLPSDVFDLTVNVDSFQEMTEAQVGDYLPFVQRAAKDGGLALNLNRRTRVGDFDNNPLLYPYAPANEVLIWEPDPFMFESLDISGRRDAHMLRVERVSNGGVG
jgi:hypothetical protein